MRSLQYLKPPQIRRASVELDMACLENFMGASGVTTDAQRAATLISAIDTEIRWAAQNHITHPPAASIYKMDRR